MEKKSYDLLVIIVIFFLNKLRADQGFFFFETERVSYTTKA